MRQQHTWRMDEDDVASILVRLQMDIFGEETSLKAHHA